MRPLHITITLLLVVTFSSACKKKSNNSPTAQKLKNGIWQISASVSTVNYMGKDTTIDHYSGWRACEQDDYIVFEDDEIGTQNENTNKCPEDEQTVQFRWSLQDNDSKLTMTLGSGKFSSNNSNTMTLEIAGLTDQELQLRSYNNISGQPATTIETYKDIK